MRAPLFAAALLALSACSSTKVGPVVALYVADGVMTYEGPIRRGSFARLEAVAGAQPVRTLRISSPGGSVTEAISMARWVYARGIDVVVYGPCFSSCANYIFPAGKEKHIVGSGILGWHGSFEHRVYQHRQGETLLGKEELAQFEAVAAQERAFYDDLGLNGYLPWFGKIGPYRVRNMYFLSQEDMEYFGLTSLHVRADYLKSDLARWNALEKNTLVLIKVDRAVTNASDPLWIEPHKTPLGSGL